MSNNIISEKLNKVDYARMFRAAMAYSQLLDWAVLPLHTIQAGICSCGSQSCPSPGKHPRTKYGVKDATKDHDRIREYWKRWPDSNIGIATGVSSGFWVLDVDGEEGVESLDTIQLRYGPLPNTVESITGSGGRHILFTYKKDMRNSVRKLGPGLDTRANGGYIVAAPSVHISGRKYEWELSSHPLDVPVNNAPGWLIEALQIDPGVYAKTKPSSYWTDIINGVRRGGRNQAAASLAGHLFRHYVNPILIVGFMELWNETNNPPLPSEELAKVLNSISRMELERRRGGHSR